MSNETVSRSSAEFDGQIEAVAQALADDCWHPSVKLASLPQHEVNKFRRQARISLQAAGLAQEPLGWPSREVVAREIRMAMLDNPTDESFNKRAEERERIANDAADVILARFAACRTPAETEPKDVSYDLTSRANALISEACGPDQSEWTKYDHGLMNICREAYERITDLRAAKEEYFALNMRLTNELAEAKGLVECSRDDAVRDCLHEIDRLRCIPINTGHDRAAALTEAYSAVRRLRDSSKSLEATNG